MTYSGVEKGILVFVTDRKDINVAQNENSMISIPTNKPATASLLEFPGCTSLLPVEDMLDISDRSCKGRLLPY